jgi:hypothetical protein
MTEAELKPGSEIIVKGWKFPLIVASVGPKEVRARIRNFPFLIFVKRDDIIYTAGQTPEVAMKGLKGISGFEPIIKLQKKKYEQKFRAMM